MKPRNRSRKWPLFILAMLFLIGGLYMGYLMIYPKLQKKSTQEIKKSANEKPAADKNTIFIPSVSIQADIEEGGPDTLDKGFAWHRLPEQGDPIKGGNMIVTGHSFVWGYRPDEVYKRSIFYDLKDIKVGDEVLINWDGKQYKYSVSKVKTVKPNAIEIEQPSGDPMLTIYTCTVGGSADGRVVVIAKPVK
jgi:sortase A